MTGDLTNISLRPFKQHDADFLFRVVHSSTGQIKAPPDEGKARLVFESQLSPATTKIVVVDGQDAGMLDVKSSDDGVTLENIHLAPEYQGQGIGTQLIRGVLQDAHQRRLPVT